MARVPTNEIETTERPCSMPCPILRSSGHAKKHFGAIGIAKFGHVHFDAFLFVLSLTRVPLVREWIHQAKHT